MGIDATNYAIKSSDGRQWPKDVHDGLILRQILRPGIMNPGNWKINSYSFKTNLNWQSSKFSNLLFTLYTTCGELKTPSWEYIQLKVSLYFILAKIWITVQLWPLKKSQFI